MESVNYPDLKNHKKIHIAFTNKLDELINIYKNTDPTAKIASIVQNEVAKWLIDHITVETRII